MADSASSAAQGGGGHPASWWAELLATAERFDAFAFVEGLANAIMPRIGNRLVRREVELAVASVGRHLLRPADKGFADDADAGRSRLTATLARLAGEEVDVSEATILCDAVCERYADAAAGAERTIGAPPVLYLAVAALRIERFDTLLAVRLLEAGRPPAEAIHAGTMMGRYQWWPRWLIDLATEHALAGTLDEHLVTALDRCAYAPLTPAQRYVARRLLTGDPDALSTAATHLDRLGERTAARALRGGDLTMVALAARLMSL